MAEFSAPIQPQTKMLGETGLGDLLQLTFLTDYRVYESCNFKQIVSSYQFHHSSFYQMNFVLFFIFQYRLVHFVVQVNILGCSKKPILGFLTGDNDRFYQIQNE